MSSLGIVNAAWSYNGSASVSCTFDTIAGHTYEFHVVDGLAQWNPTVAGDGTRKTLTVSTLGGLAAGDFFSAEVVDLSGFNECAANVFTYGTASTDGDGHSGTWSFDGVDTITLVATLDAGKSYNLQINYYNGGTPYEEYGTPFTATGASETHALSAVHVPAGELAGSLWLNQDTFTAQTNRLFAAGTADAGIEGNPAGSSGGGGGPTEGRVGIAFDAGPLDADPAFTFIDQLYDSLVSGYDISTGKQTELDRTDTGTASVYLNDTTGLFDPLNTTSIYFGKLDGKQIILQLFNPVTETWETQWRGWIDDYGYDINPSTDAEGNLLVANIQIDCVDMFDYLGGFLLQPGKAGKTAPAGAEGVIWYYGATSTDPENVQDRIVEALTDAGIDSTRWVVFSGNVNLQPTLYDPGEALLTVLRDAADAEGPFIANIYVDRFGRFVFHGIYARFAPDDVAADATPGSWDFMRWKLGDGAAIALDADRAQMRVLAYSVARSEIINSAISYPRGILEANIPGQVYEDATSIGAFGQHAAPPMTDLVINAATTAGAYPPSVSLSSANDRCLLFAKLAVENHKTPGIRIKTLNVKALRPDGSDRAAKTWDLLCRADISDIANLRVGYPGGVGIDNPDDPGAGADYYIEGYTKQVRPLNPTHDMVELDLEVSPAEWSMDTHGVFS